MQTPHLDVELKHYIENYCKENAGLPQYIMFYGEDDRTLKLQIEGLRLAAIKHFEGIVNEWCIEKQKEEPIPNVKGHFQYSYSATFLDNSLIFRIKEFDY
jgi:hypothetical protein